MCNVMYHTGALTQAGSRKSRQSSHSTTRHLVTVTAEQTGTARGEHCRVVVCTCNGDNGDYHKGRAAIRHYSNQLVRPL